MPTGWVVLLSVAVGIHGFCTLIQEDNTPRSIGRKGLSNWQPYTDLERDVHWPSLLEARCSRTDVIRVFVTTFRESIIVPTRRQKKIKLFILLTCAYIESNTYVHSEGGIQQLVSIYIDFVIIIKRYIYTHHVSCSLSSTSLYL